MIYGLRNAQIQGFQAFRRRFTLEEVVCGVLPHSSLSGSEFTHHPALGEAYFVCSHHSSAPNRSFLDINFNFDQDNREYE
jgi:hypothetical protein